jgi:protein involved in polysaccharide export with SLBB domain
MSNARYVVTTLMAITLTACGGARSLSGSDEGVLLREGGMPAGAATRAERAPEPARPPKEAGAGSAAALNSRLMEQAARSSEESDLPVGTGDLLEISVFEVEELSKIRLRVPGRGVISLPLIGQIQATGRTTAELEEEIRTRLQRKFMHEPQVSVFLQEHNSQRISVIGAVRKGGVFNLTRPLRLADALALAEGLTEEADRQV